MTLTEEILATVPPEMLANRDDGAIAALVSQGRTKQVYKEVGNGTVLEVLGITAGNALLDTINTVADFRHVKPLLEQGRLNIGSSMTQQVLQSLVPSVLTQAQADSLKALGFEPDPVTATQVAKALEGI